MLWQSHVMQLLLETPTVMKAHHTAFKNPMWNQPREIITAYEYPVIVTHLGGWAQGIQWRIHSGNTPLKREGGGDSSSSTSSVLASKEKKDKIEWVYYIFSPL